MDQEPHPEGYAVNKLGCVNNSHKEKLASQKVVAGPAEPDWMRGFGTLRRLKKETARIQKRIDEAFEVLEPGRGPTRTC